MPGHGTVALTAWVFGRLGLREHARVAREPLVPSQLATSVFTAAEASRHGVTEDHLRGASWRRVGRGVYASRAIADDPVTRLKAALRRLPGTAAFSGRTAAFLHSLDARPPVAIEATLPPTTPTTHLVGITIRRCQLDADDVVLVQGMRVMSVLRTVVDLACRLELVEAVVVLDAALHKAKVTVDELQGWALKHAGYRGVAKLRRAIELAEPKTESPMETRLRLALMLAGLPRPQAQVDLRDPSGCFVARVDLLYPEHRLVIEYDSATHRDSISADNRRQNRLVEAGYRILRFTGPDVLAAPPSVVDLVRKALDATVR